MDVTNFPNVLSQDAYGRMQFAYNRTVIKLDNPNCYTGLAESFAYRLSQCIYGLRVNPCTADMHTYKGRNYLGCASPMLSNADFFCNYFSCYEDIIYNAQTFGRTQDDVHKYITNVLLFDILTLSLDNRFVTLGLSNGEFLPLFNYGNSLMLSYRPYADFNSNLQESLSLLSDRVTLLNRLGYSPLRISHSKLHLAEVITGLYPTEAETQAINVVNTMITSYPNMFVLI